MPTVHSQSGRTLNHARRVAGSLLRVAARSLLRHDLRIGRADLPILGRRSEGEIEAECHLGDSALIALDEPWEKIVRAHSGWSTFHLPIWQRAMVTRHGCGGRLRIVTVRTGSQLTGVIPLMRRRVGWLETPGARFCDYLDPLTPKDCMRDFWVASLGLLRDLWDDTITALVFRNVRHDTAGRGAILAAAAETGFACEEESDGVAMHVPLPGTWEQYLQWLPAHERKELRRKLRRASDAGCEVDICERPDAVLTAVGRIFDMVGAAGGPKAHNAGCHLRPFIERIAPSLAAAGDIRVILVRQREQAMAGLICLRSAAGWMTWNCGYDRAARDLSPGCVAFATASRRAIEEGHVALDLLRGDEPYKRQMGADCRPLYRLTLRPRS